MVCGCASAFSVVLHYLSCCRLMRVKRLVCVSTFNKYTNAVVVRAFLFFSRLPFGLFSLLFFVFFFLFSLHTTRTTEKHSRIIHYYYVLFIFHFLCFSIKMKKAAGTVADEPFSFFAFFFYSSFWREATETGFATRSVWARITHTDINEMVKVAILQPVLQPYLKNS